MLRRAHGPVLSVLMKSIRIRVHRVCDAGLTTFPSLSRAILYYCLEQKRRKSGIERRCKKIGRDAAVRGFVVPGRLVRKKGKGRVAGRGVLISGRYTEVEAARCIRRRRKAEKGGEKGWNSECLLVPRS